MHRHTTRSNATSRANAASGAKYQKGAPIPSYRDLVEKRDFRGAHALLTLLGDSSIESLLWKAYCSFHLGDFSAAAEVYSTLLQQTGQKELHVYIAACYYHMGQYRESMKELHNSNLAVRGQSGANGGLVARLAFFLAHRLGDEPEQLRLLGLLQHSDDVADQFAVAAYYFMNKHQQPALSIYEKYCKNTDPTIAATIYAAMCYYKLEMDEEAAAFLNGYLQQFPDSISALTIHSALLYRDASPGAARLAEQRIKLLIDTPFVCDSDLVQHNMVVYRQGQGAVQVLSQLVDSVPEARLNLCIYYLHNQEYQQAYNLVHDPPRPAEISELMTYATTLACYGQATGNFQMLQIAADIFNEAGSDARAVDLLTGRQCMAASFILKMGLCEPDKRAAHVPNIVRYLASIEALQADISEFNYNYGISLAISGNWDRAKHYLLRVTNAKYKKDLCYMGWLSRCYIMLKMPKAAWTLYYSSDVTAEADALLLLIANECYKQKQYYYSAKAFDVLSQKTPSAVLLYWPAKRGAFMGVIKSAMEGTESKNRVLKVMTMLENETVPEAHHILNVLRNTFRGV